MSLDCNIPVLPLGNTTVLLRGLTSILLDSAMSMPWNTLERSLRLKV